MLAIKKRNILDLLNYGFKSRTSNGYLFLRKNIYKKGKYVGAIYVNTIREGEYCNIIINLNKSIIIPSIIYYLIKDGVIECI